MFQYKQDRLDYWTLSKSDQLGSTNPALSTQFNRLSNSSMNREQKCGLFSLNEELSGNSQLHLPYVSLGLRKYLLLLKLLSQTLEVKEWSAVRL